MLISKKDNKMATKKIKVELGEGLPNADTKGVFYKDLKTDILYFKNGSGDWEEKPIKSSIWNPVFK